MLKSGCPSNVSEDSDAIMNHPSKRLAPCLPYQMHNPRYFHPYSRSRFHLGRLNFLPHDTRRQLLNQLAAGAPHLDQVVFSSADHDPRVVPVEGEVADAVSVAAVHEEHLWRAVFRIFGRLFAAGTADVPEDCTAIVGGRAEDSVLTRVPVNFGDSIGVALK
jgi:hypothetical protein